MITLPDDPFAGRTIGQYQILARIGGGGMGVVYTARANKLGRIVALKFLPPQWSHDETAKQRFLREAQAASATNHPSICTIHDIETADDGQLFIVMAYYEGETLKKRLESGPLAVDEALDIATQVAEGLAKAHGHGIVHRDIKPGNLILTEDGVRILDFGLATFADALKLTAENAPVGTVAYMSPEQIRGQQADARSDVWAVGAVLYEMLTGHPPFRGSHPEAVSFAIRHESPVPVRAARPDVGEDVEQLVFRALHKEASVRYPSGRELARGLRQVRGLSVPVDLKTRPMAIDHEIRRRSRLRSFWPLMVGAVLLVVAVTTWLAWPVTGVPMAVAPFVNQTGDPELEQFRLALTQLLTTSLKEASGLRVVPYSRVLELIRRFQNTGADVSNREAIQAITAQVDADVVVVTTLLRDGGAWRARVALRDRQTANDVWVHDTEPLTSSLTHDTAYRLTLAVSAAIRDHLQPSRTRVLDAITRLWSRRPVVAIPRSLEAAKAFADGTAFYEDLEYARAEQAFAAAVESDPSNPLLLAWLSRTAQLMKDERTALDAASRAEAAMNGAFNRLDALFARAVIQEARRDPTSAERAYRDLIATAPWEPMWLVELAGFLDRQSRPADAVAAYHDALKLDARLPRPELELCRLYSPSRLNEPAESKKYGEAAADGYRQIGAAGGEGQSRLCLADTLAVGNGSDRTKAQAHTEAARALFRDLHYGYNEARAEYYLALIAGMQGRFSESIAIGERALAHARESGNVLVQPILMNNLGIALVSLGKRLEAADYYQRAYKLYQSWRDESRAARIQANRGAMLIEYGNPDEGILDVRNALSVSEKLGDKNFQTFCLRVIATYYRNQGRHDEAIRALNTGLAIARERSLAENVTVMTTFMGLSQFELADYDAARQAFIDALKDGTGRRSTEARLRLARSYVRLGDFASAATELETTERELEASPNKPLQALWWLVNGERAYASGRMREARNSFERASTFWTDTVPEPAAVEGVIDAGFLDANAGRIEIGRKRLLTALDAARKLGQLVLEVRCLMRLAELEMSQGRLEDAETWLNAIPADRDGRTIGPELRAGAISIRGRVQQARADIDASAASFAAARSLIQSIVNRLPEAYRASFVDRTDIKPLLR